MNSRKVGGITLGTLATGAITLSVIWVIQRQRQGSVPSDEDLNWVRELVDRLRSSESGAETQRSKILAAAYRDLMSHAGIIESRKLRRRLGRIIRRDPDLPDAVLIDLERLLMQLEEAVARRSIGKEDA